MMVLVAAHATAQSRAFSMIPAAATVRSVPNDDYRSSVRPPQLQQQRQQSRRGRPFTFLLAAAAATDNLDLDSKDPFTVLGLQATATLDKKDIKRAYKRAALKYHPDVVTNKDSATADKKAASDRFAKINWAYATLMGKNQNGASSSSSSSSSSTTGTSTGAAGREPPHRRRGGYGSSSSSSSSSQTTGAGAGNKATSGSTDWRDYMPQFDKDKDDAAYDAGGDSFGSIFSDLFAGAAATAASASSSSRGGGRGGIFRDFVEFLETNVDGYSGSGGREDDAQLFTLLQTGSVQDVGEEMDDTELVVQSLGAKLSSLKDELAMLQAQANIATRYLEKMELQEQVAELNARKSVVEGYLKQARKRLLSLQTRYKQLIVQGDNDPKAGGRSRRSTSSPSESSPYSAAGYASSSTYPSSSSYSSEPRSDSASSDSSPISASTRATSSGSTTFKEDAWKDESFGSFGRGRGNSRQKSRRRTTSTSDSSSSRASSPSSTSPAGESASSRSSSPASGSTSTGARASRSGSTSSRQAQTTSSREPPHRRQSSDPQYQDDKGRLRELKVDEEFEKLKKELGM